MRSSKVPSAPVKDPPGVSGCRTRVPLSCMPRVTRHFESAGEAAAVEPTLYTKCDTSPLLRRLSMKVTSEDNIVVPVGTGDRKGARTTLIPPSLARYKVEPLEAQAAAWKSAWA